MLTIRFTPADVSTAKSDGHRMFDSNLTSTGVVLFESAASTACEDSCITTNSVGRHPDTGTAGSISRIVRAHSLGLLSVQESAPWLLPTPSSMLFLSPSAAFFSSRYPVLPCSAVSCDDSISSSAGAFESAQPAQRIAPATCLRLPSNAPAAHIQRTSGRPVLWLRSRRSTVVQAWLLIIALTALLVVPLIFCIIFAQDTGRGESTFDQSDMAASTVTDINAGESELAATPSERAASNLDGESLEQCLSGHYAHLRPVVPPPKWLADALDGDAARLDGELMAFNWEKYGWCVSRLNKARAADSNVLGLYELQHREDHALFLKDYGPSERRGSWVLLEPVWPPSPILDYVAGQYKKRRGDDYVWLRADQLVHHSGKELAIARKAPVAQAAVFELGHCSSTACTLGAGHIGLCSHLRADGKRQSRGGVATTALMRPGTEGLH